MVREALRGLSILGVVESRQGGRCYITDLTPARLVAPLQMVIAVDETNVDALYEARLAVEGALVRLGTMRASEKDLARLSELVAAGYELSADPVGFRVMDHEFHLTLSRLAGNPFLARAALSLYELGMEFRRVAAETPGRHRPQRGRARRDRRRAPPARPRGRRARHAGPSHLDRPHHLRRHADARCDPPANRGRSGRRGEGRDGRARRQVVGRNAKGTLGPNSAVGRCQPERGKTPTHPKGRQVHMTAMTRTLSGTRAAALSAAAISLLIGLAAPGTASADEASAKALLKGMSDYMATLKAFSFDYDTSLDAITPDLEKITFASSGTVSAAPPDKIRATRSGGFADVEMTFDGKTLTMFGKTANAYAQAEMPGTVQQVIDKLRDMGASAPGADLLAGNVYDTLMGSVTDLKDLGSGVIGGVECDHIAARAGDVDWQLWIAQGKNPYPCRFTVVSKLQTAAPQYDIRIANWKSGADVAAADFSFKNTTNAAKKDLKDLPNMDELPTAFAPGGAK